MLFVLLVSSSWAEAGTFPVVQEQVRFGTTTGIAGSQAEDGLRETLTEADVPVNLTTSPSAQNVTTGSQVAGAFPSDVAALDGVYTRYRETTPGPVTVTGNPGTTTSGCTWISCDSGRLPDNVSASSAVGGDVANYTSFSLVIPASSVILSVSLGYEAFNPAGNDRLSITISWDGGTTWCPAFTTGGLPSADPNAYTFVNLTACGGHAWNPTDLGASLVTRFTHVTVGGADAIDLDANTVRVTYQPLAYQLSLRYDWAGIPSGAGYALALTGHITNDSVSVEVLTPPSTWAPRLTIGATTDQNLSCTLAPTEIASGNVAIRFVDALGSSPTPSDLWVDLAEIVTVRPAYRLDVVQNVTGITGADPTLAVEGNISLGSENFDVFVWDFSTSAWTMALGAPFTATNTVHSVALTSDEISNGLVQVDFRDRDPTSPVPATLTLDLVRVDTTDAAAGFPWAPVLGGVMAAVVAIAAILFLLILPRRRRSASATSEELSAEPAAAPPTEAKPAEAPTEAPSLAPAPGEPEADTPEVPTVDAKSLVPGHAYFVMEDEPGAALRALEALTRLGRSGLVLTRRSESGVASLVRPRHTTVLVLGDGPEATAGPITAANRDLVRPAIQAFLRTNPVGVILFDGLESLAARGGLPTLLDLVQQTAEEVSVGQQVLLASASPGSLHEESEKRLRKLLEFVRVSAHPTRA